MPSSAPAVVPARQRRCVQRENGRGSKGRRVGFQKVLHRPGDEMATSATWPGSGRHRPGSPPHPGLACMSSTSISESSPFSSTAVLLLETTTVPALAVPRAPLHHMRRVHAMPHSQLASTCAAPATPLLWQADRCHEPSLFLAWGASVPRIRSPNARSSACRVVAVSIGHMHRSGRRRTSDLFHTSVERSSYWQESLSLKSEGHRSQCNSRSVAPGAVGLCLDIFTGPRLSR